MIKKFTGTLFTGILAILPFIISISLVIYMTNFLIAWFGPSSAIGGFIARLAGAEFPISIAYFISLIIVVIAVWLIGYLTRHWLGWWFRRWVESLIARIPLINTVYHSVDQLIDLLKQKDHDSPTVPTLNKVVLIEDGEILTFGLLAYDEAIEINGIDHMMVFVPTSPLPTSGFNQLVPCDRITRVNLSAEELTKTLVTFGTLGPIIMKDKKPLILSEGW